MWRSTLPPVMRMVLQAAFFSFLLLVAYLSLVDRFPFEIAIEGIRHDRAEHAIAFLILTLLSVAIWVPVANVVLLLVGVAGSIEIAQMWLPDRQAEWVDFLASCSGIALGVVLYLVVRICWVISGWLAG